MVFPLTCRTEPNAKARGSSPRVVLVPFRGKRGCPTLSCRPSILVHAGFLDDLAPFFPLGTIEGIEVLGRSDHRSEALGGQRLLDFGCFQRLFVGFGELVDDVLRGGGWRRHADPE